MRHSNGVVVGIWWIGHDLLVVALVSVPVGLRSLDTEAQRKSGKFVVPGLKACSSLATYRLLGGSRRSIVATHTGEVAGGVLLLLRADAHASAKMVGVAVIGGDVHLCAPGEAHRAGAPSELIGARRRKLCHRIGARGHRLRVATAIQRSGRNPQPGAEHIRQPEPEYTHVARGLTLTVEGVAVLVRRAVAALKAGVPTLIYAGQRLHDQCLRGCAAHRRNWGRGPGIERERAPTVDRVEAVGEVVGRRERAHAVRLVRARAGDRQQAVPVEIGAVALHRALLVRWCAWRRTCRQPR